MSISSSIGLYIHIPWCLKKCGYCDFNSHVSKNVIPEKKYIQHLLKDFQNDLPLLNNRVIKTIFIGGGTPSLLKNIFIKKLIDQIKKNSIVCKFAEISIESNPKILEYQRFADYKNSGINRFSLGVQTFNTDYLKKIERTYDTREAINAIVELKKVSNNINFDLMYGLPDQSIEDALQDLQYAIKYNPAHISWYQLSIEPNTPFYAKKLILPNQDIIFEMMIQGEKLLNQAGYKKYEISSYSKSNYQCQHNLNYWNFGDYIGIGCGAHGKITQKNGKILRTVKNKNIQNFLDGKYLHSIRTVLEQDKPFEYFINKFRLYKPISKRDFQKKTNININNIKKYIEKAKKSGFLIEDTHFWETTKKGKIFLNLLLSIFLK
ncbi:MAG: radical SAM family heme chaperone HemW [Buchnera aphidicola (Pentalonia nigronervosa)]|jgi:oxygen-independent coproporphyrinogen-3 oxidase|uniref:Heme chaperone HemW n=1 Tax=Buchnera aphidicola (Pentalonia nigronervosa) TaxID=1309793 RepID=A0A7H1AZ16_9GAMM|nr:MAG: radical SAM family heme chaperone HemW [Buchnera aphidicola (Pentalonia nigronervosa)]